MSKEANCLKSAIYYAKKHKQTEKLAILLTKRETINEHKRSIRLHEQKHEDASSSSSDLKNLQSEINGRIVKATILGERLVKLKNDIDYNNHQLNELQQRVSSIQRYTSSLLRSDESDD